jgi:hypothetical protein
MKIGVEVQIDVKKIEKDRLYQGQKGTYLTMTTFIDTDQLDQYGNNGFIAHKKNQDEQVNPPILGNVKVFWSDAQQTPVQQTPPQQGYQNEQNPTYQQPKQQGGFQGQQMPSQQLAQKRAQQQAPKVKPQEPVIDFDDDIPF